MAVAVKGTANTSATTSVTIPTHAIGDLIVLVAYKTSTTAPTKPSASGTVPAWVTIDTSSGNSNSFISTYFVATASNHTSGTWTGATSMVAIVLTGQSPSVIGGHAGGTNASSLTVTGHTITLTNADGSSAVLDFWARTATVTAWNAVSGFTDQATTTGTSALALSTKNDSTSVSAQSRVSTGTATVGANDQFEIVSGPHPTDTATTSESVGSIIYEPINTSESVNVVITSGATTLSVNVSDSVTTNSTGNTELEVSFVHAADATATSETVALNLPGFTYSVNVSDSTSIAESKTVNPPNSTPAVSVSDSTSTSEWIVVAFDPPIVFTLEVSVSDSASTAETVAEAMGNLTISDSDSTSLSETLGMLEVSFVNKSDSASTGESTGEQISSSQITVSDSVTTGETIGILDTRTVSVTDATTVSESVAAQDPSPINVSDSVSTNETVQVTLPTPGVFSINALDSVTTGETVSAQLGDLTVNASDSTSATESRTVAPLIIGAAVSDSTSTTETPLVAPLLIGAAASDSTSTTEALTVSLQPIGTLSVTVSDSATVSSNSTAASMGPLVAAVSDSTSTSETVHAFVYTPSASPEICFPTTLMLASSTNTLALSATTSNLELESSDTDLDLTIC